MKIFIFCATAAFGKGGMEKMAIELANFLSDKNIVHLGYFEKIGFDSPAYATQRRVVLAPWNREKNSRIEYKRRIQESLPDVFIYFGVGPQSIQIVSLLYGTDIPLIIHEGSNPERIVANNWAGARKISRYKAFWERELIYSQANGIRFTMDKYKSSLPEPLSQKVHAFPNAFKIPDETSELIEKRIINIGGLKVNKNIKPLLMACKKIFMQHPDWFLDIYSTKVQGKVGLEYAENVENFIKENGLSNNVFIRDETEDIYNEYLSSSIHVITSLAEGLSNAVSESMCCGVPSIGVKGVPGVDGLIVHDNNGLLVDEIELEDNLVQALNLLIEDCSLRTRLGSKARKDAEIFNPQVIREKWLDLIDFSINNKLPAGSNEVSLHFSREIDKFYSYNIPCFDDEVVLTKSDFVSYAKQKISTKVSEESLEKKERMVRKNRFLEVYN